ncbi:hypothetical protein [Cyanothece sp. BG0011]|uniref:hypothetical protein n=1 Tax=Cyanothece sp. BG0011 TaxID=2082950 RepID=UPI000D1FBEBC|nr:hypothetical protein [Cyanothece sp. BG0011]
MTEREFETIINKLDNLDRRLSHLENKVDQDNRLLSERIDLYRQTSETQINSIRVEMKAFQVANQQQIEGNRQQIEAFQEANKQQLNVSLGGLVTAAPAILASVVLGMQ